MSHFLAEATPFFYVAGNCKRQASWLYTHVSRPQSFVDYLGAARRSRNSTAGLLVVEGAARGNESQLRAGMEHDLAQHWFARQCLTEVEPLDAAMRRQRQPVDSGDRGASLCERFGLLCPQAGRRATHRQPHLVSTANELLAPLDRLDGPGRRRSRGSDREPWNRAL